MRMNATLRTEFDEFLHAQVAADSSGMPLTLLSVLARRGVDPWDEAASIASLSHESALQKLGALLASVPNGPAPGADTTTIATRLLALLHRSPKRQAGSPGKTSSATTPMPPKGARRALYYIAALLLFLIAGQWAVLIWHEQSPADTSSTPISR
jgi:hypothetical protein